jgi:hypothetical protein
MGFTSIVEFFSLFLTSPPLRNELICFPARNDLSLSLVVQQYNRRNWPCFKHGVVLAGILKLDIEEYVYCFVVQQSYQAFL